MTELALILLISGAGLELLLYVPFMWPLRKPMASVLLCLVIASSVSFTAGQLSIIDAALLTFGFYRCLNLFRLLKPRTQLDYLYNATRSASLILVLSQVAVVLLAELGDILGTTAWIYIVTGVQLVAALMLLASTLRHVRTTHPPVIQQRHTLDELPTLTVAIPARNETDDLEACLQSLVASTYPKLEIVVLDDQSQDKRTPEIIRGFAQAGVRFIPGETPPEHWLAKNYAYDRLSQSANGQLILFCGVDTRFAPDSLRQLVETLIAKHKNMVCILPRNDLAKNGLLESNLLQPARYAWELALPRRLLERPPVLSTCWLISTEILREAGGFEAVSRKIIPESYFARYTASHNDSYSFLRAEGGLDIGSSKSFAEQKSTAVRTRYPQLHRRAELVGLVGLAESWVLLWPLAAVVYGLTNRSPAILALGIVGYALSAGIHSIVASLTYRKRLLSSVFLMPVAVLYDIWVLNYSMWQYEFGVVYWKGRNITAPVMRAQVGPAAS